MNIAELMGDISDCPPKPSVDYFDKAYWKDASKSGYRGYGPGWHIHWEIGQMLAIGLAPWLESPRPPVNDDDARVLDLTRVLDVGGAFGYHMKWLQEFAPCIGHVVDASAYAILNLDRALDGRGWHLDAGVDKLPFPDNYFHRVVAIESLEHIYIKEVPFAIREIARVLDVGGILYSSIAMGERYDPDFIDITHQTMRPEVWWVRMLERAGLERRPDIEDQMKAAVVPRLHGKTPTAPDGLLALKMRWNVVCCSKGGE